LEKDSPVSRAVELARTIRCRPVLGGCTTNMFGFDLRRPQAVRSVSDVIVAIADDMKAFAEGQFASKPWCINPSRTAVNYLAISFSTRCISSSSVPKPDQSPDFKRSMA